MDNPFAYDGYVTGKQFLNRGNDTVALANLLSRGENVVICSPPKSGKMSLVRQTLFEMRNSSRQHISSTVDILNVRSVRDFLLSFGNSVIRTFATTPQEYSSIVLNYLPGTHYVFDQNSYSERDEVVSLNWDPDEEDILAMLRLPYCLAADRGLPFHIVLNEFQNVEFFDGACNFLRVFENVIRESRTQSRQSMCTFIMTGSKVNAMKDLFGHRKFFWKLVEHFSMAPFSEKEVTEYIVKGLLSSGKVMEKDLAISVFRLFRGNMWYINHFVSICDHLSKGYVPEPVLVDALRRLVSIHEPGMKAMVNDLTTFQLGLLNAVIDGNVRLGSSNMISTYHLNSPANVKRLKDALMKKEILTFNESGEPEIMDPLFEYWLGKYFFKKRMDF